MGKSLFKVNVSASWIVEAESPEAARSIVKSALQELIEEDSSSIGPLFSWVVRLPQHGTIRKALKEMKRRKAEMTERP